jgi:hypothetical protein
MDVPAVELYNPAILVWAETGESIGEAVLGLRLRQAARLLAFTTR